MADPAPQAGLECPSCGVRYGLGARFCEHCHLPLVHENGPVALEEALSERQRHARKIKPQLAEGTLVHVVQVRNQAEGEFVQGLLLEEGVPSLLRRSAGFDVPDFLAGGPRDVLVPQTGLDTAREVLLEAEILSGDPIVIPRPAPLRLLAGLLIALILGALLVWALALVIR